MPLILSFIIPFLGAQLEGGEGESSIPVYQLASLYWWGALLLISLVIFIVWLVISWQARFFDRQMLLAGSHGPEQHADPLHAPVVSSPAEYYSPPLPIESLTPDDLTLIEGIGPVISRLLQSKGIYTFTQLSQADPQDLMRFMKEANLRLANTSSWAEQARIAASGDINALRAYQSRLKGGREV